MELLPDLVLLPHELLPGSPEPLGAPANARIEVEGTEVLLRVVRVQKGRYVVFLRRGGENFLLHSQTVNRSGVMMWKEPPKQEKLERIGHYAIRKQWRLFFPIPLLVVHESDGMQRVACTLIRSGIWRFKSGPYSARWLQPDLSDGFQFSFEDKGDVLFSLQKAVEESDSLANRMWQLQGMTTEERAAFHQAKHRKRASKPFLLRLWTRLLGLD